MTAKWNYVRQQGFPDASPETCRHLYPALMWQPRMIAVLFLVGLAWQAAPYFLALGALLWWNVLCPALNPFDAVYNLVAKPTNVPRLPAARAPRRFAQAEAGTVIAAIGVALIGEVNLLAWILEGIVLVSLVALNCGNFCQGSYLYLLFTGQSGVANGTLRGSAEGGR